MEQIIQMFVAQFIEEFSDRELDIYILSDSNTAKQLC
jgi:hypothetical protein